MAQGDLRVSGPGRSEGEWPREIVRGQVAQGELIRGQAAQGINKGKWPRGTNKKSKQH